MLKNLILALPLLSIAYLAVATPLDQREASPGLIDDLLGGLLSTVGQLIKDILTGVKSGISDEISSKPLLCLSAVDKCCICT